MIRRAARFAELQKGLPRGRLTVSGIAAQLESMVTSLAIFVAPVRILRLSDAFITLSDLLFAGSLLLLLASGRLPKAPLRQLTSYWLTGIVLLTCGLLLSSIINGNPLRGLIVTGQYTFAFFCLPFVLISSGLERVQSHIKAFIAGMVFSQVSGIAVYFTGWDPTGGSMVSGSGRLMSFLEDPNANANMVALTLPFVLYLWIKRQLSALVAVSSVAVLSTAVVLTSSVGGLIVTSLGLGLVLLATMRLRVIMPVLLGAAVIVASFWFLLGQGMLPAAFQKRVAAAIEAGDVEQAGSFSDRVVLMREALEVIGEDPFVGIGADQFRRTSALSAPVHNAYLLLWAEGGLFAFVGWLMLLSATPLAAILLHHQTRSRQGAATTFAVGIIIAMVAFNNAHMYGRFWAVPLLLAAALSLGSLDEVRSRKYRAIYREG